MDNQLLLWQTIMRDVIADASDPAFTPFIDAISAPKTAGGFIMVLNDLFPKTPWRVFQTTEIKNGIRFTVASFGLVLFVFVKRYRTEKKPEQKGAIFTIPKQSLLYGHIIEGAPYDYAAEEIARWYIRGLKKQ